MQSSAGSVWYRFNCLEILFSKRCYSEINRQCIEGWVNRSQLVAHSAVYWWCTALRQSAEHNTCTIIQTAINKMLFACCACWLDPLTRRVSESRPGQLSLGVLLAAPFVTSTPEFHLSDSTTISMQYYLAQPPVGFKRSEVVYDDITETQVPAIPTMYSMVYSAPTSHTVSLHCQSCMPEHHDLVWLSMEMIRIERDSHKAVLYWPWQQHQLLALLTGQSSLQF